MSGPRPCPWVGCRHHLLLEVALPTGRRPTSLRLHGPLSPPALVYSADERTAEVWTDAAVERLASLEHSCTLDVVHDGQEEFGEPHHAQEIAALLGVSRQCAQAEIAAAAPLLRDGVRALLEPSKQAWKGVKSSASKGGREGVKNEAVLGQRARSPSEKTTNFKVVRNQDDDE